MKSQSALRRQHYVNKTIQGQFLRRFASYWLVYTIFVWHGLFLLDFWNGPASASGGFVDAAIAYYPVFARENTNLLICAVALLPLVLWDALKLTHRIAGPLERFRGTLENLMAGKRVSPVTLRRDDLLVDYQRVFNRYLAFVDQQRKERGDFGLTESNVAPVDPENPLVQELEFLRAELQQVNSTPPVDG